jgi:hypothetical protein
MSDHFITREEEDQGEACCFAEAVFARAEALYDLACTLTVRADRGDWTIPVGMDCAAFEARITALTADIQNMMDGYRPGERA